MTIHPSIIPILIRPQMGENIGAAARAMANFGVSHMRLAAPRDGWPNPKAGDVAGKAIPILDDAVVFNTAREAVEDCHYILATSSRERAVNMPAMDLRAAMVELHQRAAQGQRCAVMFGPERTGLENDDIALADAVVSIPVAPEYPSLNLGQAVVCTLYEWFISKPSSPPSAPAAELLAPRAELFGMFDQFETALDDVNFWRVPEKKEGMWRNIRAVLTRAGMNAQEVATWRGILRALHPRD